MLDASELTLESRSVATNLVGGGVRKVLKGGIWWSATVHNEVGGAAQSLAVSDVYS